MREMTRFGRAARKKRFWRLTARETVRRCARSTIVSPEWQQERVTVAGETACLGWLGQGSATAFHDGPFPARDKAAQARAKPAERPACETAQGILPESMRSAAVTEN
ncbi:MAG: hypothetical protein GF331_07035 [Chitinivibrionales bacterium]|nr:hypothetical protein [Chitinivibrionales bacterium]